MKTKIEPGMFIGVTNAHLLDGTPGQIIKIYDYWATCRGERGMPRRSDFDPVDLPRHLPGLLLVDVLTEDPKGSMRYRYRVVGQWEVNARGHNPTGRFVDEGYHANSREAALAAYDWVREHAVPMYEEIDFVNGQNLHIHEHSIMLPLSEDGTTVSQIIVYSEPARTNGAGAYQRGQ